MSQSVDDILRELSGISFAPSDEQPSSEPSFSEDTPSYGKDDSYHTQASQAVHTPSVTETLMAVRELIEQPGKSSVAEENIGRPDTSADRDTGYTQPQAVEKIPDSRRKMSVREEEKTDSVPAKAVSQKKKKDKKQPDNLAVKKRIFSFHKKADKVSEAPQKAAKVSEKPLQQQTVEKETADSVPPRMDGTLPKTDTVSTADSVLVSGAVQPSQPVSGATGQFTPLVRVTPQELAELGNVDDQQSVPVSRRERLVLSEGRTRRFVSTFPPEREEKLQGGAALRRVTRPASSNHREGSLADQLEGMTLRIPVQSASDVSEDTQQSPLNQTEDSPDTEQLDSLEEMQLEQQDFDIDVEQIRAQLSEDEADDTVQTDDSTRPIGEEDSLPQPKSDKHSREEREKLRRQQQQQLLSRVEATENEPAPELSRSEIRKLKKQQQQEDRQRQLRRMQQKEEQKAASTFQQEEKENIYRVREVSSSETAAGFSPAFKRLQRLNSAAEISSWRRALRDLAGTSIGMGLLIGFFAVAVLVLVSLTGVMGELVGSAVLMWSSAALGLIAGICGFGVISGGISSLVRFRASRDIMPAVVYLVTMAQTVLLAFHPDSLVNREAFCYLPVGLFLLSAAYLSRWMVASTALRNLRFLHTGGNKYYLHVIRDSRLATEMTRGVVDGPAFVAVNRRTESVSDFMKLSLSSDESDRLSRNFAVIGLLSGLLVMGFALLFGWNIAGAASLMTSVVCLFSPILTMYLFSYPCRRTARFMERAGGVVISEKAIARYSLLNGALMDASDIFPPGFVTLSGLKTFGSARVDDVIIDAASMILGSGSVLESIFEGIVGDSGLLRPVEDRQYEDGKGLVGFVDGRQVLVGNKALLESRGIRFSLDEHRKWAAGIGCTCVYLAVAGELAGVFLIRLQTSVRSEEAVQIFADNGIRLAIRTTDSFLTPRLLGRLFRVNPELIKILPQRLGVYVDRLQGKVRVKQAVAVNDGSLSGFAGCAACARRLSFMEGLNRVMMVLSVVLGLGMLLMLTVLGSFVSVTPLVLSGYAVFWPLLGWILQKMIRI